MHSRTLRVALAGILGGLVVAFAPGVVPGGLVRADEGDPGVSQMRPVQPDPGRPDPGRPDPGTGLRPAPQPDCKTLCDEKAERALKACAAAGGARERCRAAAAKAKAECLARCNTSTLPTPACEERCEEHARALHAKCLEMHDDPKACGRRARAALAECLNSCRPSVRPRPVDPVTPGDPRACQARCTEAARASYETCVAVPGNDPVQCRADANALLEECLAGCRPGNDEPPSCADRCAQLAREVKRTCMANGGSEADCAAESAEAFDQCLGPCDPRPGDGDCATACRDAAREAFRECVAAGREEAACSARARAQLERCMAGCG